MQGLIKDYDCKTGSGTIVAHDGHHYPFHRSVLVHNSKEPRDLARVDFRLADGQVAGLMVVSHRRQWEWIGSVAEALLYVPLKS